MSEVPAILDYLIKMGQNNASDLYLTVGTKPTLRVEDKMMPIGEALLSIQDIEGILSAMLTNRQKREFDGSNELNTALDMGEHGRFRVNVMKQRQQPALVIRRIVSEIPNFEDLKLPPILGNLALENRGLVLITGITGQVGQELQDTLSPLGDIIPVGRKEMDLTQPESIRQLIALSLHGLQKFQQV